MFIISFSQLFLYDYSQGVIIIFLLSTSCPEVEEFAFYTLYYIKVCKSKTYLILKNIFNRVQN